MKNVLIVLIISASVFAQEKPKTVSKTISEVNKFKMISAFQKSQNLQMQVQQRAMDLCKANPECGTIWNKYQQAVDATNTLATEVQHAENLAPGTSFSVDTEKETVTVSEPVLPLLPLAPKAEPKK